METGQGVIGRVWGCILKALPKAGKTCLWLLKIILPISLLVRILQYSGILGQISDWLVPVFSLVGLPGDSHCFYNQYILPIICSDRFDHLDVFRSP